MTANVRTPPTNLPWVDGLVLDINREIDRAQMVPEYTVATVPDAATKPGLIAVTDETGGYTIAFSDGSDWRRVQDRAVIS